MNGHRWGAEGPPLQAYSRVTNPERFASLHDAAAELLDRFELEFDCKRTEGYGLDPELEEGFKLARPSVAVVPRDVAAAPIVVVFSAFPGLRVRFGNWCMVAFPACGCDACDEMAESETKRLSSLIENVTAGRYRESIQIPADGVASRRSEFWSVRERCAEESQVDRTRARLLVAARDRSSYHWRPWPKRSYAP
jgi:hypothetical protein